MSADRNETRDPVHHQGERGDDATSLSLLDRARKSDPAAWERLVELYEPLIDLWCRRDGLSSSEADDARQEVFLSVAQALGRFERRKDGSFRSWLRSVTRSKAADVLRRRGPARGEGGSDARERLVQVEADSPRSDDEPSDSEEIGILYRRAMELIRRDFSAQTCDAFLQAVVDKRKAADVAADLGMSTNAVRLAKARVLQRLRAEFVGLIEGEE